VQIVVNEDMRRRREERERAARLAMRQLLENIPARLPELAALHEEMGSHWHLEDRFYRFYHHSFKLFALQEDTLRIVDALRNLAPGRPLDWDFEFIIREGTGHEFSLAHNGRWHSEPRRIVEAFFHAYTMLGFVVRYGKELAGASGALPSGWAAVLYLFDLRYTPVEPSDA
jgi:hypothetical protein